MRPPLSLPLAPPGDAPSAFVIFVLKSQKFKLNKRRRKSLPSLVERFLRVTPFPSSNLLLCVFGCSPGWRGSHRPRACWLFWQCSYPPLKRCKARGTFRSFVPPLTEHLWQGFRRPSPSRCGSTVRTRTPLFLLGTNERGGRTHQKHATPSAAGSIAD